MPPRRRGRSPKYTIWGSRGARQRSRVVPYDEDFRFVAQVSRETQEQLRREFYERERTRAGGGA